MASHASFHIDVVPNEGRKDLYEDYPALSEYESVAMFEGNLV